MSGTTSVPAPSFGPLGFVTVPEDQILAGAQADINAALGGGINPALETPQGQLASSDAAIIADCYAQFIALASACDPQFATGRAQDGIGRIYFITRIPAQSTVVQCTCVGQVNGGVPTGAVAQAADGNFYTCVAGGAFGLDGTVSLGFACQATGPISCPAGSLTTIYSGGSGWDTISNPAEGVLGNAVETAQQFELRRQLSVSVNSVGNLPAVQAAVLGISGVLDAYTTDNATGSPVVSDGVTLPSPSMYVCVAGGAPATVAQAIWTKKMPGCPMAGNTTVVVQDTNSFYSPPLPTYNIKFQTAVVQECIVVVTISNSSAVPSTAGTLIQGVVLNAFAGADGGPRARIGSVVHASRFYPGIYALGTWANIVTVKLGSTGSPSAVFNANAIGTVLTVSSMVSGVIGIGQTVTGAGLADNVMIASFGSGSGGTGSYNLSFAQTFSTQQCATVAANLDLVTVGIAHVPTLDAGNIVTVLQ